MTAPDRTQVLRDLADEGRGLDAVVGAPDVDWATPTPSPGWTVAHQIAHLAWTDALTLQACRDPDAFVRSAGPIAADVTAAVDAGAAEGARQEAAALLPRWRNGRAAVLRALAAVPPGVRIPWLGPPMGAGTMASARIMETWAHGVDIRDALGVPNLPGPRLRHVAELGVRTRDFAFRQHGLTPPADPFRVELATPGAPSKLWTWGPPDADQRLSGPAEDFCLLVTRRRHPADLALVVESPDAERWLRVAQVFAGPPGAGRTPQPG